MEVNAIIFLVALSWSYTFPLFAYSWSCSNSLFLFLTTVDRLGWKHNVVNQFHYMHNPHMIHNFCNPFIGSLTITSCSYSYYHVSTCDHICDMCSKCCVPLHHWSSLSSFGFFFVTFLILIVFMIFLLIFYWVLIIILPSSPFPFHYVNL
jgi:hypothetical protein